MEGVEECWLTSERNRLVTEVRKHGEDGKKLRYEKKSEGQTRTAFDVQPVSLDQQKWRWSWLPGQHRLQGVLSPLRTAARGISPGSIILLFLLVCLLFGLMCILAR